MDSLSPWTWREGGSVVKDDELQLFEGARSVFTLSSVLEVTYASDLRFELSELRKVKGFGICFMNVDSTFSQDRGNCILVQGGWVPSISNVKTVSRINGEIIEGDMINLALRKPAVQSSVFGPGDASLAVDGSTYAYFDYDVWTLNTGECI